MGIVTFGKGNSKQILNSESNSVVTTIKEVITEVEVPVEVIKEVSVPVETIKEVIKEIPIEVVKYVEVIKEVPVEVIKEVIIEKIKAVEVKVVDQELTESLKVAIYDNEELKERNNKLAQKIEELQITNVIINEKIKMQTKLLILGLIGLVGLVLFN